MTIEGRPDLNVDWQKEYDKQRRCRLSDAIDDYLQDENVDPRFAYEEMLSVLDELIRYHNRNLDRAQDLKNMMIYDG